MKMYATRDRANGGLTNIDDLTFACPCHHKLVTTNGWTTHKSLRPRRMDPPPQLELPGGSNNYHHPERYLKPPDNGAKKEGPCEGTRGSP
jgi:hypothetical protein